MAEKRTQRTVLTGNPVSAGAAVAEAFVYKPQKMEIGRIYYDAGKKKEKLDAFHRTVELAKEELTQLAKQFEEENGEQSGIFLAHREMLEDEELISETELAIRDELLEPDSAIEKVFSEFAGLLGQVEKKADAIPIRQFLRGASGFRRYPAYQARLIRFLMGCISPLMRGREK